MANAYSDVDRRVWEDELEAFVPMRVFDAHAHIFLGEHCVQTPDDPVFPRPWWVDGEMAHSDLGALQALWSVLAPGREVHYLLIPFPFSKVDMQAQIAFTAAEAAKDPASAAEMVVTPQMDPAWVAQQVDEHGFVGLKPYVYFAPDPDEGRIVDMIGEGILQVADDRGLVITLHLGKHRGLADPENIADIRALSARYPRIRWILAHCGRSWAPWAIEGSIHQIKDCPNLWFDTSAVCDTEVFNLLLDAIPPERILFGTDAFPVGNRRGRYVGYGYSFTPLPEVVVPTPEAAAEATFVMYESLRALRYAVKRHGWGRTEIQGLFHDNAARLLSAEEHNA
jgi:predicted TIM-barrel fold metal-dependent hydrolase